MSDALSPRAAEAAAAPTSPIIAQAVIPERHSYSWVGVACLAALGLAGYWIWSQAHRPIVNVAVIRGSANRLADDTVPMGDYIRQRLPGDIELFVPVNGMESQLLGAIATRTNAWVDFDKLTFPTGSASLRPGSSRQVDNIAAILRAYPNVHLRIAGYTDSVGTSEENMKLSWARADAVKNELIARGIGADRLTTGGFGESTSDSGTAAERAGNRSALRYRLHSNKTETAPEKREEELMNYEKIVTLFDNADHADAARQNLEGGGFSTSDISVINNKTLTLAGAKLSEPGLWHRLFGKDIQPYEAIVYGRSVQNGGVVLSVRVPEEDVPKATRILNQHEAVDLQKRAMQQGLITTATMPKAAVTPAPATMAAGSTLPTSTLPIGTIPTEEVLRLARNNWTWVNAWFRRAPPESAGSSPRHLWKRRSPSMKNTRG